ncbi:leucine-rich repeat domain-containing protein [Candidatus Albibeggiatoa sp. nov. NOAA]|uniref:leucine-rich repeat domain-containing protein n=1 Tax=Candidatus Albibeggiatoa sp. nov. NOAA TaxID=3162724 RepID=UPI0032FDD6BF|nr:hypothetical protein [Thiotrichaceae bacterium]
MTPAELSAAKNLKRLWNQEKNRLGLTQASAAEKLGWANASAFGQYLNGNIAMNFEAVFKIAALLEIDPREIQPDLPNWALRPLQLREDESVLLLLYNCLDDRGQGLARDLLNTLTNRLPRRDTSSYPAKITEPRTPNQVEQRIAQVRRDKTPYLDLSACELSELPDAVWELTWLEELDLYANHLTVLPSEIAKLKQLRILDMEGCPLQTLPAEIGTLCCLEELNLHGCQLQTLPAEIGQLSQLQLLDVYRNRLHSLPDELGNLSSLRALSLGGTALAELPTTLGYLSALQTINVCAGRLRYLPTEIGTLPKLEVLRLAGCQLESLPDRLPATLHELTLEENHLQTLPAAIGALSELRILDVGGNLLTALPEEIRQLTQLEWLYLGNNRLTELPASIRRLTRLQKLDLRNNHLAVLPQELVRLAESLTWLDLRGNPLAASAEVLEDQQRPARVIRHCLGGLQEDIHHAAKY